MKQLRLFALEEKIMHSMQLNAELRYQVAVKAAKGNKSAVFMLDWIEKRDHKFQAALSKLKELKWNQSL